VVQGLALVNRTRLLRFGFDGDPFIRIKRITECFDSTLCAEVFNGYDDTVFISDGVGLGSGRFVVTLVVAEISVSWCSFSGHTTNSTTFVNDETATVVFGREGVIVFTQLVTEGQIPGIRWER